jgi:hypothetical protein
MLLKVVAPCTILEMIARRVNFSLYWGKTRGKVVDIKGWVLADLLDDAQFELLLREAKETCPNSRLLKAAFLSILRLIFSLRPKYRTTSSMKECDFGLYIKQSGLMTSPKILYVEPL